MSCQHTASRRRFLTGLGNTLALGGASAFLPGLALLPRAARAQANDYKALVCIYLAGANDSYNLLVPRDSDSAGSLYDSYRSARGGVYSGSNTGGLALDFTTLLPISPAGTTGYGLHPACADFQVGGSAYSGLQSLFAAGDAAFVCNMGPLVQPISKRDYDAGAPRPPQLFAHNDQELLWHVGMASSTDPLARFGWGGRIAGAITDGPLAVGLSPTLSIAGAARFLVGDDLLPYQLSSAGVNTIDQYSASGTANFSAARRATLDAILGDPQAHPMAAGYASTVSRSLRVGEQLAALLDTPAGQLQTVFPDGNTLAEQLQVVARMIKVSRDSLGARRQVYYVRYGSFDLHDGMFVAGGNPADSGHGALLSVVNQAVGAFWAALGEIGARDAVTTFSMSEFARTLSGNGSGSDHAWGGHQFVIGGAVQGGRLYGRYPRPAINANDDSLQEWSFSRGQFIPTTSLEQYAASFARWMGVTDSATLNTLFPRLSRFAPADLGLFG